MCSVNISYFKEFVMTPLFNFIKKKFLNVSSLLIRIKFINLKYDYFWKNSMAWRFSLKKNYLVEESSAKFLKALTIVIANFEFSGMYNNSSKISGTNRAIQKFKEI